MKARLTGLEQMMAINMNKKVLTQYGDLLEQYQLAGGYEIEATNVFPQTFYNDMHVWKLPASQTIIEGLKLKESEFIQRIVEGCATSVIERKPDEALRIAMLIFPQNMWHSQIIVFKNTDIENNFFERQVLTGHWQPVMNDKIHSDWVVKQFTDATQNLFCYIER